MKKFVAFKAKLTYAFLINLLFCLYSSKTRFGRPTLPTRRRRFSFDSRSFVRVQNDKIRRLYSKRRHR